MEHGHGAVGGVTCYVANNHGVEGESMEIGKEGDGESVVQHEPKKIMWGLGVVMKLHGDALVWSTFTSACVFRERGAS